MADVLLELLNLAERTEDYRLAIECYWEYAALQAIRVMEDFDTRLAHLCQRLLASSPSTDRLVLDMSRIRPGFVSLAARLYQPAFGSGEGGAKKEVTVDRPVSITIIFSNMTPLIMNVARLTMHLLLSDGGLDKEQVIIPESNDVLPGAMSEFNHSFHLPRYGTLVLDSIAIDLADLPLRLHWHSNSLCTVDAHSRESLALGGWDELTANGRFWRALEMGPFLEENHRLTVSPLLPTVEMTVRQSRPLIQGGHPCPLLLSIHNPQAYPVEMRIHFNPGPAYDLTAEEEEGGKSGETNDEHQLKGSQETESMISVTAGASTKGLPPKGHTRLSDLTMVLNCAPGERLTRTILIRHMHRRGGLVLRTDCHSIFAEAETRSLLSSETVHTFCDLPLEQVEPLTIVSESVPGPTTYAIRSTPDGDAEAQGRSEMSALIKYRIFVQLTCHLEGGIVLREWSLEGGHCTCLYPPPSSDDRPLALSKDESLSLLFEISSASASASPPSPMTMASSAAREEISPNLRLEAMLGDDPTAWTYSHQLPSIPTHPRSLLIIPIVGGEETNDSKVMVGVEETKEGWAYPVRVGRALAHRWRVWNGEGRPREILIKVEPAEPWVYMGIKQIRVRIEAASFYELRGWLVPLLGGPHSPPSLSLQAAVSVGSTSDPVAGGAVLLYETLARPPIYVLP